MKREPIGPDAILQHGKTDHLIVVFSSISALFTRYFDGKNLFRDRPEHVLFLRDPSLLAYHTGLTDLTGSIPETVEFLNYLSGRLGVRRRTFYGSSSGGYAAILHGVLCGAEDVFTVNPTTFLSETLSRDLNCPPHPVFRIENFVKHYATKGQTVPYDDLAREMRAKAGKRPMICLHYAAQNQRDNLNARHMAQCPGVFAIPHATDEHDFLPLTLARQGRPLHHITTGLEELEQEYAAQAEKGMTRHAGMSPADTQPQEDTAPPRQQAGRK